jgi:hypothetical protein
VDTGDWAREYADIGLVRLADRSIFVVHDLKRPSRCIQMTVEHLKILDDARARSRFRDDNRIVFQMPPNDDLGGGPLVLQGDCFDHRVGKTDSLAERAPRAPVSRPSTSL